ncbi:hypothetical protein HPB48_017278 [Haemaphysalis longicornis]|uniref:RING-type domain-containing protein n=1 Tax=Haemaphysalis longicornis TaxID=44386 RepID=A0A9J6FHP4_HAELO|nr:hypothetical protein HPB48_017278 [Haemaphysalis longicornis]
MAHNREQFVMVGYSEDIDRRPLKFVDPIPASRICSACGNIPKLTFMLVCGHTFCEPCYQSCATTSECVCPLDGDVCGRDDVSRKDYPADQLLRRKVHCWNEINGCGVVIPASQVAEHVRNDCQHHVTRCPMCLAVVLSLDMCAHLKSRCAALVVHAAPEAPPRTEGNEQTYFMAFEKKIEQRVHQIDAKLAQLSLKSESLAERLIELCHNDNQLKEALIEQFRLACSEMKSSYSEQRESLMTALVQSLDRLGQTESAVRALVAHEKTIEQRLGALDAKLAQLSLESDSQTKKLAELCHNDNSLKKALTKQFGHDLDRNAAEMKALCTEKSASLMTALTSALTSVPSDRKTHQQVVTGYATLKETALKYGSSAKMSEKVYIRRYLVSWGVYFKKEGDTVNLYLRTQLHQGKEDDFLEWPFTKELKLSIIHPQTRQELVLSERPNASGAGRKYYCRPIGASNVGPYFPGTKVDPSDIESDGYVERDQLLVRLEVGL